MSFSLLPYLSFALSLSGLLVRVFLPSDSRKITVLGIVITCLVVITSFGFYQAINHKRHVEATANEIVTILHGGTKTLDEVQENLYKADFRVTTEALDGLVATDTVGHRILKVRDDLGRRFRVRAYYLITKDNEAELTRPPRTEAIRLYDCRFEEERRTRASTGRHRYAAPRG